MRHINVKSLWLQEKALQSLLKYNKVRGEENPADGLTKHVKQDLARTVPGNRGSDGKGRQSRCKPEAGRRLTPLGDSEEVSRFPSYIGSEFITGICEDWCLIIRSFMFVLLDIFYSLRDTPPAHQWEASCMRSFVRSFARSLEGRSERGDKGRRGRGKEG